MQASGQILKAADLFVTVCAEELQRLRLQKTLETSGERIRAERRGGKREKRMRRKENKKREVKRIVKRREEEV